MDSNEEHLNEQSAPKRNAESIISKVFKATVMRGMSSKEAAGALSSVSKADLVEAVRHMSDKYVSKEDVGGLLDALKEKADSAPVEGIKEVLHEALKHEEEKGDYIVTIWSSRSAHSGMNSYLVKRGDADSPEEAAQIAEDGGAYTYGLWPYHKAPEMEKDAYHVEVVGGKTRSVSDEKIDPQEGT